VLALERRGTITGLVVDAAGTPVAGARVRAAGHEIRSLVTDAQGRFAFSLAERALGMLNGMPARQLSLVASHGALASEFRPIDVRDAYQSASVTLQLGAAGIAGRVVDLDGAPVPHADIWLNFCCGKHAIVEGKHAEADDAGRFSFDVPRGDFLLSVRRTTEDDFDDRDDRSVPGGTRDVRLVVP